MLFKTFDISPRRYWILKSGESLYKLVKERHEVKWGDELNDVKVDSACSTGSTVPLRYGLAKESFIAVKVKQVNYNGVIDYIVWSR